MSNRDTLVLCNSLNDLGSLPELVKHGKNGLIFTNAEELANQLEVRRKANVFESRVKRKHSPAGPIRRLSKCAKAV